MALSASKEIPKDYENDVLINDTARKRAGWFGWSFFISLFSVIGWPLVPFIWGWAILDAYSMAKAPEGKVFGAKPLDDVMRIGREGFVKRDD